MSVRIHKLTVTVPLARLNLDTSVFAQGKQINLADANSAIIPEFMNENMPDTPAGSKKDFAVKVYKKHIENNIKKPLQTYNRGRGKKFLRQQKLLVYRKVQPTRQDRHEIKAIEVYTLQVT